MTDLRTVLDSTAGPTVNLGNDTYTLKGTAHLDGRVLIGWGASIRVAPSTERTQPAIILTGDGPRLLGRVTLTGPMPDGNGYNPDLEAQHAIQVDGANNAEIGGWTLRNIFGDGISVGTVDHTAHKPWTDNLLVHDTVFDQVGRHALNIDALDHGHATRLHIGRVNMAIVDLEPPGHPWGCKYFAWTDSELYDSGGGFVLADKGVGTSDSVHDITVSGIRCHRRLFNVQINPPARTRRQRFTFRDCSGDGIATQPVINLRHVDGARIDNIAQRMRNAMLVEQHDCTDVVVDGQPVT